MTKIRAALLAFVTAVLALPPVFGMLTEARVAERVESMNAEGRFAIAIERYDRGWFTSRAVLGVAPGPDADPAAAAALLLGEPIGVEIDFNHGPLSFQDGFFVGFSEMHARAAVENRTDADMPPEALSFEVEAQATFGGAVHFRAYVPWLDRETDAAQLGLSGAVISGTLAGRRVSARASAETLRYRHGPKTLYAQGLRGSAHYERDSRHVAPGRFELRLERAAVDLGSGMHAESLFEARGVALECTITPDSAGERLDGELHFGLDAMHWIEDIEVTDVLGTAAVQRIDAAAVASYSSVRSAPIAADAESRLETLEPALIRFLAAGPRLTIDSLRFKMDADPFDASLSVEAVPERLPASGPLDLADHRLWFALLDGRLEIAAAKPLAERLAVEITKAQLRARHARGEPIALESLDTMARAQAGFALALLSAQGIIDESDSLYRTRVLLEDGELTVNGETRAIGGP